MNLGVETDRQGLRCTFWFTSSFLWRWTEPGWRSPFGRPWSTWVPDTPWWGIRSAERSTWTRRVVCHVTWRDAAWSSGGKGGANFFPRTAGQCWPWFRWVSGHSKLTTGLYSFHEVHVCSAKVRYLKEFKGFPVLISIMIGTMSKTTQVT